MDGAYQKRVSSFTLQLIRFIDTLPHDRIAARIADQLLRSGTSILANLTEGEAASSRRDFTNYMNHALKSAKESLLWCRLLRDSGRCNKDESVLLETELEEYIRILTASVKTLRRSLRSETK